MYIYHIYTHTRIKVNCFKDADLKTQLQLFTRFLKVQSHSKDDTIINS